MVQKQKKSTFRRNQKSNEKRFFGIGICKGLTEKLENKAHNSCWSQDRNKWINKGRNKWLINEKPLYE